MRRPASFTLVAVETGERDVKASGENENTSAGTSKGDSAKDNPSIGGFIVAEAGSRARGHIITIDVVAAARRSGVGSLLLRAAEDRLIMAECRAVELETAVDNLPALAFYERHGYSVIRTFPRYYSNGVDALVLEKTLV